LPRSGGGGVGRRDCTGGFSSPPAELVVAPGRACPLGAPGRLPRSSGEAETPAGGAAGVARAPGGVGLAFGGTRPGLPLGPGEPGAPPAAGGAKLAPVVGGGLPPPRAAAPVGAGMFLGFSVLIFCFSCASLGTPAQPRLSFGCATFVFTTGGLALGGALASFGGAATTSLFPWTFVSAPDLAAAERLVADCRSMLSR
jgi:hypothetical protein